MLDQAIGVKWARNRLLAALADYESKASELIQELSDDEGKRENARVLLAEQISEIKQLIGAEIEPSDLPVKPYEPTIKEVQALFVNAARLDIKETQTISVGVIDFVYIPGDDSGAYIQAWYMGVSKTIPASLAMGVLRNRKDLNALRSEVDRLNNIAEYEITKNYLSRERRVDPDNQ